MKSKTKLTTICLNSYDVSLARIDRIDYNTLHIQGELDPKRSQAFYSTVVFGHLLPTQSLFHIKRAQPCA